MAKTADKSNVQKNKTSQPRKPLGGGSYIKDPETGGITLMQETKRETSKPIVLEK